MLKTNIFEDAETRKCHVYDPSDCNEFMRHDAAMAHALVMALRSAPDMTYQRKWLFERADELLTSWGYPNTEYPQDIGMAGKGEENVSS